MRHGQARQAKQAKHSAARPLVHLVAHFVVHKTDHGAESWTQAIATVESC